jgi:hypothetical protein
MKKRQFAKPNCIYLMRIRNSFVFLATILLTCRVAPAWGATLVMVEDFEKVSSPPTVWAVNIPNENASVQLSTDQPHEGGQCLKLHYHFVGTGNFQYLGIPNKVRIQATVHKLRFWLKGDNSKCSYGVQVSDASGETHQYSKNTGQGGIVDFTGWKEVVIDLDSGHETWGGDKNGKIDYPITAITLTIGQPTDKEKLLSVESDLYFDALSVDSEKTAEETLGCQVSVVSPDYGCDIQGDTPITLEAPGFKSVTVRCWKQGGVFGSDSTVATVVLDAKGNGSFVFPANAYPHGPITYCIEAVDNPNVSVLSVTLPREAELLAEHRDGFLGGVTVLQGKGLDGQQHPVTLTAVPYYSWANREKGAMTIWINEAHVKKESVAYKGTK